MATTKKEKKKDYVGPVVALTFAPTEEFDFVCEINPLPARIGFSAILNGLSPVYILW